MAISIEQEFGLFRITISELSREDAAELANLLASAESPYLRRVRLELESELMELSEHEGFLMGLLRAANRATDVLQ